jgi:hypothetical protein
VEEYEQAKGGVERGVEQEKATQSGPKEGAEEEATTAEFATLLTPSATKGATRGEVEAEPVKVDEEAVVLSDFYMDSKGKEFLSAEDFEDSVFQLADTWCDSTDMIEYVEFLDTWKQLLLDAAERALHAEELGRREAEDRARREAAERARKEAEARAIAAAMAAAAAARGAVGDAEAMLAESLARAAAAQKESIAVATAVASAATKAAASAAAAAASRIAAVVATAAAEHTALMAMKAEKCVTLAYSVRAAMEKDSAALAERLRLEEEESLRLAALEANRVAALVAVQAAIAAKQIADDATWRAVVGSGSSSMKNMLHREASKRWAGVKGAFDATLLFRKQTTKKGSGLLMEQSTAISLKGEWPQVEEGQQETSSPEVCAAVVHGEQATPGPSVDPWRRIMRWLDTREAVRAPWLWKVNWDLDEPTGQTRRMVESAFAEWLEDPKKERGREQQEQSRREQQEQSRRQRRPRGQMGWQEWQQPHPRAAHHDTARYADEYYGDNDNASGGGLEVIGQSASSRGMSSLQQPSADSLQQDREYGQYDHDASRDALISLYGDPLLRTESWCQADGLAVDTRAGCVPITHLPNYFAPTHTPPLPPQQLNLPRESNHTSPARRSTARSTVVADSAFLAALAEEGLTAPSPWSSDTTEHPPRVVGRRFTDAAFAPPPRPEPDYTPVAIQKDGTADSAAAVHDGAASEALAEEAQTEEAPTGDGAIDGGDGAAATTITKLIEHTSLEHENQKALSTGSINMQALYMPRRSRDVIEDHALSLIDSLMQQADAPAERAAATEHVHDQQDEGRGAVPHQQTDPLPHQTKAVRLRTLHRQLQHAHLHHAGYRHFERMYDAALSAVSAGKGCALVGAGLPAGFDLGNAERRLKPVAVMAGAEEQILKPGMDRPGNGDVSGGFHLADAGTGEMLRRRARGWRVRVAVVRIQRWWQGCVPRCREGIRLVCQQQALHAEQQTRELLSRVEARADKKRALAIANASGGVAGLVAEEKQALLLEERLSAEAGICADLQVVEGRRQRLNWLKRMERSDANRVRLHRRKLYPTTYGELPTTYGRGLTSGSYAGLNRSDDSIDPAAAFQATASTGAVTAEGRAKAWAEVPEVPEVPEVHGTGSPRTVSETLLEAEQEPEDRVEEEKKGEHKGRVRFIEKRYLVRHATSLDKAGQAMHPAGAKNVMLAKEVAQRRSKDRQRRKVREQHEDDRWELGKQTRMDKKQRLVSAAGTKRTSKNAGKKNHNNATEDFESWNKRLSSWQQQYDRDFWQQGPSAAQLLNSGMRAQQSALSPPRKHPYPTGALASASAPYLPNKTRIAFHLMGGRRAPPSVTS